MQITEMKVKGDTGTLYKITVEAPVEGIPVIMCTCRSWKFMQKPVQFRSCKHITFVKANVLKS